MSPINSLLFTSFDRFVCDLDDLYDDYWRTDWQDDYTADWPIIDLEDTMVAKSNELDLNDIVVDDVDGFVVDFSEIQGPTLLPDGSYIARISKVTPGVSKNGNKKWDIQWKIEKGEFERRVVFDTLTFTEAAMFRVRDLLTAVGAVDKEFRGKVSPSMIVDKFAMIQVTTQASTGINPESGEPWAPRNNIKKYVAVDVDNIFGM